MNQFDWKQYITNYSDLQHLNEQGAIKHYIQFGKREGRTDKKKMIVDLQRKDTILQSKVTNVSMTNILQGKVISGEKIQLMCDYFIGSKEDINYNPVIYSEVIKHPWKWIDLFDKKLIEIKSKSILKIFCYTWIPGNHLDLLKNILLQINEPFLLYFHNSDGNFLKEHYTVLNIPNCKQIYSQNNTVSEVITLPIGQANSQWKHGDEKLLLKSMNSKIEKTNNIFLNFTITTPLRIDCKNILLKKGIPWIENKEYSDYLNTLASYHYCICVEGNGLDTHRFWECLYLRVIPICVKNEWTDRNKGEYPMIVLNDWNELCNEKLISFNFEGNFDFLNLKHFFPDSVMTDSI